MGVKTIQRSSKQATPFEIEVHMRVNMCLLQLCFCKSSNLLDRLLGFLLYCTPYTKEAVSLQLMCLTNKQSNARIKKMVGGSSCTQEQRWNTMKG